MHRQNNRKAGLPMRGLGNQHASPSDLPVLSRRGKIKAGLMITINQQGSGSFHSGFGTGLFPE